MNRLPSLLWKCTQRSLIVLSISPIGYKYWSKCTVNSYKPMIWTDIQPKYDLMIRSAHLNGNKTIDKIRTEMVYSFVAVFDFAPDITGKELEGNTDGSGFFISPDGYVLTNTHVTYESKFLYVKPYVLTNEGEVEHNEHIDYPAELVYVEPQLDLALLRVVESKMHEFARIGRLAVTFADQLPEVGQRVVALGNPELDYSVCDGLIDNGHRMGNGASHGYYNYGCPHWVDPNERFITSSTPISVGYSGGPLINMNGHVVGVNYASLDYMIQCYSTPAAQTKEFIKRGLAFEKTYRYGRHSVNKTNALGIAIHDFNNDLKKDIQLKPGMISFAANLPAGTQAVMVWYVLNTSAYVQLQLSDGFEAFDIIIKVNEYDIKSVKDLKYVMKSVDNNQDMKIIIWRNKELKILKVKPNTIDQAMV